MLARLGLARGRPAVFVLGVQKSGTTAVATLLASLTGKTLTSDFTHIDPIEYRTRVFDREVPFDEVVRRHRDAFRREIVKDPNLTFFLEELRGAFPEARIVFISRDPRETLRSTLDWMGLPGDRAELDTSAEPAVAEHENWRLILDGRWPRVAGRNYVERLALRWRLAADLYLAHRDDVALIRYEDFVRDKAGELARLAGRLGLAAVNDIAAEVDVQFQSRGDPRPWLDVFGESNLRCIESACHAQMDALGYSVRA